MKVLYVFRSLAVWGGIERILVDKMNYLVNECGDDVYMLTADQGAHALPYQLADGVHFEDLEIRFHQQYQYHGLKRVLVARRLEKLFEQRLAERLRAIRPDVIVCTTANYVDLLVKLKGAVPLVVESHSVFTRTFRHENIVQWMRSFRLKRSLKKADVLVALTEGDACCWKKLVRRVEVIPNMVHLSESVVGSHSASKRVIFVGRFDYQKRPQEAIRIWQLVQQQYPDWSLEIYGEGEQKEIIEEMAQNLNVHVHRPTAQIFDRYRECAFLILPSLFEPFGMVMPEAMSCGLPVVAYDVPYGPSAILSDGVDGYLVDCDDAKTFAHRMMALMSDPSLRLRMGKAALESSRRFSADKIMPQWKQLFEELKCRAVV